MVRGSLTEDEVKDIYYLTKHKGEIFKTLATELVVEGNDLQIIHYETLSSHQHPTHLVTVNQFDFRVWKWKKIASQTMSIASQSLGHEARVKINEQENWFKSQLSRVRDEGRVNDLVTTKLLDFFIIDAAGEKDPKKLEHAFNSKGITVKVIRDAGDGHLMFKDEELTFEDYLLK